MVNGGFLRELTISNPDAGTKIFYGIKEEDSTYILGGYTKENTTDGGGRLIANMQPKLGSIQCTCSNDMSDALPEFEFLQACMNSLHECSITFANANTEVYGGSGTVDGDCELNATKSSISFKLVSGGDGFVKQ